MFPASAIEARLSELPPEQLRAAISNFLPKDATTTERVKAIEDALRSPAGQSLRDAMSRCVARDIKSASTTTANGLR